MSNADPGRAAELARRLTEHGDTGWASGLNLVFTEISKDVVRGKWTVDPGQHQAHGVVHGGVYCTVVEHFASVAALYWYGKQGTIVGVNNNTDFLRGVREGVLSVEATPAHRGRLQQLWLVVITDEQGRTVARGQVRVQNLPKQTD